jgi:CheY-like chemotaxis protein/two-component sensor histidine kinase
VPIELSAIVARAVETSRPLIDERRHKLTVEQPDTSLKVTGDLTRLAQVVGNLLNNAAKYTEEGGTIHLSVEKEGAPAKNGGNGVAEAVIRVKDTGVGIPQEMLPNVFDLFTQVERTLDRAEGGLGIGLALVRSLVELHGGRVEALSKGAGQGSEFVVRLPCLISEDGDRPSAERDTTHSVGPSLRILVVDDNRDVAGSMALLLQLGGHQVFTAHDGEEALEVAAKERPGVILLDIGLPGMDGYEVCRQLRSQVRSAAMIIAMTGYGQAEDRQRSMEAGFDAHQIKPVDHAELMKLLLKTPAQAQR